MSGVIEAVTFRLATEISDLSQTKWNKLMFFIDGVSFCRRGLCYTDLQYIKLPYGPVPNNYEDKVYRMIQNNIIEKEPYQGFMDSMMYMKAVKKPETEAEMEKTIRGQEALEDVLNKVIAIFRAWTAGKMSNFTHELAAWKNAALFKKIDLALLKNDPFLKKTFNQANLAHLIMGN